MGCLVWFLLLPLVGAFWLAVIIANVCAKKGGGLWRLLGVVVSVVIGGVCVQVGYWYAEEVNTILGWIIMIGGGLIAILGTWTALVGTKEEVELREEMKKLDEEEKQKGTREDSNL